MLDPWAAPLTRQHTFSTGRTATLRLSLPIADLFRTGRWDNELAAAFDQALAGSLEDYALAARLHDSLVYGMFVDPQIVPEVEVDAEQRRFSIHALEDEEIRETIDAAFGGAVGDASFRGDDASEENDPGSDDVEDAAEPTAGTTSGERRRASGGRKASGAPGGASTG